MEGNHMSRMSAQSATSSKVTHEKIAQRAYEKWLQRGRPHGDGVQDWLEAEKEMKDESMRGGMMPPPSLPAAQRRQS
jgi:DUF2934 family protein